MKSLDDRIMAATQSRDSGFFNDYQDALSTDNNNNNNIKNNNNFKNKYKHQKQEQQELSVEFTDMSSSTPASLTSPSAAASRGNCSQSGVLIDPDLPVRQIKVDVHTKIQRKKKYYYAKVQMVTFDNSQLAMYGAYNSPQQNFERDLDLNEWFDHIALTKEIYNKQNRSTVWDRVNVTKMLDYQSYQRNVSRDVWEGISSVLCVNEQFDTAKMFMILEEQVVEMDLDYPLTQAQRDLNYVFSGIAYQRQTSKYNRKSARGMFGGK